MLKVGQAVCNPTPVKLVNFRASSTAKGIQINWQSAQEIDLVGFNLLRAETLDRPQVKINPQLIPGINPGQLPGNDYQYLDETAETGKEYYYWIEWVGDSYSELYGPLTTRLFPFIFWIPIGFR
jgi:hypothetical protein